MDMPLILFLLKSGSDPMLLDKNGLHHAVMRGSVQLSQALLAKGIDPNAQSIGGRGCDDSGL